MSNASRCFSRRWLLSAALVLTPAGAAAHHGWHDYDVSRTLELSGAIRGSTYEKPHGTLTLAAGEKLWHVVLAPPTRMQNRGLTREMLEPGTEATVVGYRHKKNKLELRAERITIAGKTFELRR